MAAPWPIPDMPNCLATVGGMPLLAAHAADCWRGCGVRRVGITVGWQGGADPRAGWKSCAPPSRWAAMPGRRCAFFDNPDWDQPNGLSVLAARAFVTEPTLLLMADQIAAPALVERFVAAAARPTDATVLGIDRELSRVFDIDDATKVALASEPRGRLRGRRASARS